MATQQKQQQQQQTQQQKQNHMMRHLCCGSVQKASCFDPEADAKKLYVAMKGIGTDERTLIGILCNRCNQQRQEIIKSYAACYDKDLNADVRSELSGHLKDVVKSLLMTPRDYDAYSLQKAMKGPGTDEVALVEVLCTSTNDEIRCIQEIYSCKYKNSLVKDIEDDTGGDFKKLLLMLLTGKRDETCRVDEEMAKCDADLIKCGDPSDYIRIFASRNYMQLCALFEEYKKMCEKNITEEIDDRFSGDMEMALKSVVRIARNTPGYFAHSLYHSMKGLGTRDTRLIRIVVSRSEIDMEQIKIEFELMYKKPLVEYIKNDTSGEYKKALLFIVDDN